MNKASIAYFDLSSGIAGDMVLGAFIGAGLPVAKIKKELSKLDIGKYSIRAELKKSPVKGINFTVKVTAEKVPNHYTDIDKLIKNSALSTNVKKIARDILRELAIAEAAVHGSTLDHVHFHEVGSLDSIVDIVGAAIGFDYFKFKNIYASRVPMSLGTVECSHGTLNVPVPAVMEMLKGVALEKTKIRGEIVTPTGMAILKAMCSGYVDCPIQVVEKAGYGYGDRKIKGIPNALRLIVGKGFPVVSIQANIDDMNPEIFEWVFEKLFTAGAVDVDVSSIQMKKNRPAFRINVLSSWDNKDSIIDLLLKETSTFGVRYWPVDRKVLKRDLIIKKVKSGKVTFKLGIDEKGRVVKAQPEYEDLKKLAKKTKKPLIELYSGAMEVAKKIMK